MTSLEQSHSDDSCHLMSITDNCIKGALKALLHFCFEKYNSQEQLLYIIFWKMRVYFFLYYIACSQCSMTQAKPPCYLLATHCDVMVCRFYNEVGVFQVNTVCCQINKQVSCKKHNTKLTAMFQLCHGFTPTLSFTTANNETGSPQSSLEHGTTTR